MGTITGPPADPPRRDTAGPAPAIARATSHAGATSLPGAGTGPDQSPASTPPRRVRAVLVGLLVVVLAGAGLVVLHERSQRPVEVSVTLLHDETEMAVEVTEGTPLAEILAAYDLRPVDGRLLSVTGSVIDDDIDPGRVLVDGIEIDPGAATIAGRARRVEVVDGVDEVEASHTVEEEVPVPPASDVMRHVEEGGRPGLVRRTVGAVSGEVESTETLVAARPAARTTQKVVALTFDDGPSVAWTPYVLEILRSRGVKATFCMVGTAVEKNPDLARRVVAEGHQICNHSHGHDLGLAEAGQDRIDGEVGGGRTTLTDHGLPAPGYYRPPGGYLSDAVIATARAQGERVLMWKVDTKDWQSSSTAESVLKNLREQVEPGAVILMHDGGGRDRTTSIAVLATLIDELRAQGYGFTFPVIDPA